MKATVTCENNNFHKDNKTANILDDKQKVQKNKVRQFLWCLFY